jgi:outer membrane protein TolC
MKKRLVVVLLCCLALSGVDAQVATDTLTVSLDDALEIALSESPTVKVADKEIERVRYAKKETVGGLLPTVSLSGAYQRAILKQKMYMDAGVFAMDIGSMLPPGVIQDWISRGVDLTPAPPKPNDSSGDEGIEINRDNTFTSGISASMPLIAPALWSTVHLSEMQLELALESARASKIDLVNQVSKAYYNVLMAQDSYAVIKRSYDNSVENSRVIKGKYDQGTVSEFEWIRADVQARNNLTNVVSAESGVNLAILQLKMLMGIDMFTGLKVMGNLSDFEKTMYGDVLMIDNRSLEDNTDLKQFDLQTKQLEQSLKINKHSALPTLALNVDYMRMSMVDDKDAFTSKHRWFGTSNLSLALSVPLFQGGAKHHKNKQIKVQLNQMELNRLNMERGLELQAINYLENIKKSLKKIESDKEGVRQAEKAVDISRKMYEVGMATLIEVNDAELAYISAGLTYNQSIYDYLSNKADLEKILGNEFNQ